MVHSYFVSAAQVHYTHDADGRDHLETAEA
jgi:hypothetical protein